MSRILHRAQLGNRGGMAVLSAVSASTIAILVAGSLSYGDALRTRNSLQSALDAAVLSGAGLPSSASGRTRIGVASTSFRRTVASAEGTAIKDAPKVSFKVAGTGVEAQADAIVKAPLVGLLGLDGIPVAVRSHARKERSAPICLLALEPTQSAAIDVTGNAEARLYGCSALANSDRADAIHQAGRAFLSAREIGVRGSYKGTNFSSSPLTGIAQLSDPLASVRFPAAGACKPGPKTFTGGDVTLSPGTYCGGLKVLGESYVTLEPGVYIFKDGPLWIESSSIVRGEDVLIAFTGKGATLHIQSGGRMTVTSPRSGDWSGIQFFADRIDHGRGIYVTVIGSSRLRFDGVMYFPTQNLWFAGASLVEGRSASYTVIAKKVWFQDNTEAHIHRDSTRTAGHPSMGFETGAVLSSKAAAPSAPPAPAHPACRT